MIELPFPAKILWPNGRGHHMVKHRATKKHRQWAHDAALAAYGRSFRPEGRLRLIATFYPKPRGPVPDRDGCSASLKAYQDGIADALRVNDNIFDEPRILIGERTAEGGVSIVVEAI